MSLKANVISGIQITVNGTLVGTYDFHDATVDNKVDIAQGVANANKILAVNSEGNVVPITMTVWEGGSY